MWIAHKPTMNLILPYLTLATNCFSKCKTVKRKIIAKRFYYRILFIFAKSLVITIVYEINYNISRFDKDHRKARFWSGKSEE